MKSKLTHSAQQEARQEENIKKLLPPLGIIFLIFIASVCVYAVYDTVVTLSSR